MVKTVNSIQVFLKDQRIGRLAMTPDRFCAFEYDPQFLVDGFSISPIYLPLRPGLQIPRRDPFDGAFGVFRDSLPDGWGHLLLDQYLVSQGIQPNTLSFLDRLSLVGSNGMGALEYRPDHSLRTDSATNDLEFLANEVAKVLNEADYSKGLDVLVQQGGSSGGARPKVLVDIQGSAWIVKFPSSDDPAKIGKIEYEYSEIAKQCGIEMPETALLEGKYFGVRRFDREKDQKFHMHTASGLLYASHRFPSLDYTDLIKTSFVLTKAINQAYKIFRLMIFNVLTGNRDDHSKNFSFIYRGGDWHFAPAYDLVPSEGFNGNHSTTVAGKGKPELEDILSVAKKCGLNNKIARGIFDEVYSGCAVIRQTKW